jgi:hypothetical protein
MGTFDSFEAACLWWRGRCGWALEMAESALTCPIPTLASKFYCLSSNELARAEGPLSVNRRAQKQFATTCQNFIETRQNSRS